MRFLIDKARDISDTNINKPNGKAERLNRFPRHEVRRA